MRELKKEFIGRGQVKGFMFTQIEKNSHAFLYEIRDDNRVYYEVFHRKENNRYNCISYPSNKAFGVWAWTYLSLQSAKDRFDDISNEGELKLRREFING